MAFKLPRARADYAEKNFEHVYRRPVIVHKTLEYLGKDDKGEYIGLTKDLTELVFKKWRFELESNIPAPDGIPTWVDLRQYKVGKKKLKYSGRFFRYLDAERFVVENCEE